jgi:ketosteroid isomerase-like protein
MSLERKARAYIAAVEGGAVGEDLAAFYHPDVIQEEYPNRLTPAGVQRDLAAVLAAAEAGQKLLERQIFDIHTLTEVGDRVILEMSWTGLPRAPMGSIRPGEPLRARFAQVIEFEDGLIIRQRNYDCFDPF